MGRTRAIPWILVLLVLAPTAVLAWLGFHSADAFDAAANARLKAELDEAGRLLASAAPDVRGEVEGEIDRLLAARAQRLARDLPLLEPAEALGRIASTASDFLSLGLVARTVRLLDEDGEPVYQAAYDPHDEAPDLSAGSRDVALAVARREADRAYYGPGGLEGAVSVWQRARAAFATERRRAIADVEIARLRVRAGGSAAAQARALDAAWREDVLARAGRPALLLWLAASAQAPEYRDRLRRLWKRAAFLTTPLTAEERRRLAEAASGQQFAPPRRDAQWGIPFEHEVASGARLRVFVATGRLVPLFRERLAARLAGQPVGVDVSGPWPPWLREPAREITDDGLVLGRHLFVAVPGGVRALVRLDHAGGPDAVSAKRTRRWVITIGVVCLVLISVLGLALTARAVRRERAARRLRDDFIANVTHEVRTPLTSVLLHSEMLLDASQPAVRRKAHAEVVRAQGQRLAALVDGLLDFAALERGRRQLEASPVDLARACAEAIAPYRVLAEREGREVTCDVPAAEVSALADPTALARILANLVSNAWRYGTPARDGGGGRIRVLARQDPGGARVEVRDDGPGIPPAERAAVFDRFARGEANRTQPGTGIGLSLARDLARAMEGELELVDDDRETVFRLRLPPVPEMTP